MKRGRHSHHVRAVEGVYRHHGTTNIHSVIRTSSKNGDGPNCIENDNARRQAWGAGDRSRVVPPCTRAHQYEEDKSKQDLFNDRCLYKIRTS